MGLPINPTAVYTLKVPSTQKEWKYRPFLVKEEKSLLIAQQSEDPQVMLDTIKAVIKSCSKTELDVDSLASFDVEYIFTQLRSISVGETVELMFRCDDCEDDNAIASIQVDLRKMQVKIPEGHTKQIGLFDDVGMMMKYPTIDTIKKIESSEESDVDQTFDIVTDCIDYIYDSEQIYPAKEQSQEELAEFLNNLTSAQFDKIQSFFRTMPSLRQDITYTCPVCKKVHNKYLEGLSSFF